MNRLKNYFLAGLGEESYVVQQKAYAYLWVSLVFILLMIAVIIFNMVQAFRGNLILNSINSLLIMSTAGSLVLLRKGRYLLSTHILIVALTLLWIAGVCLKMEWFLQSGVNSYLYFLFGLMVFVSFFGTMRTFLAITVVLLALNTAIIVIAAKKAEALVFRDILNQSVNIYIGIAVVFTFSFLLSRITSRALERTEQELAEKKELNESLERKVEERTRDIEAAMDEVSVMNDSLVQINRELEQAQQTMTADMKMAVNVQQSFLPRKAPETGEWDIAFAFRPMAGVSGDFYDFYTDGSRLQGISLFDVSGHGIASGLVTMIAKSIIFRNFITNMNNSLDLVMNAINGQLVQELDNVDNYLTGILLRLNDGNVEYVNAGHPDIFIRRHASGEIVSPIGKGNMQRGPILAAASMRMDYPVITLKPEAGDSFVLFSDCLYESANTEEEQYGFRRLRESLGRLKDDHSAANQLDSIVGDLLAFIGTSPLKDDLTVIVLKKKTA